MPKLPWHKYFPQDVLSDPALKRCSEATRGIWWFAWSSMMLSGVYSIEGSIEDLARECCTSKEMMELAVADLIRTQAAHIAQHEGNIVLTSKRLMREFGIKELRSKAGKASATQRQQKVQHTTQHTSASASASASVPVLVGGAGGRSEPAPSAFDDFWKLYPKRVGKGDARKVFDRKKCAGLMEKIIPALEAQKKSESWTKDGGRFVPNPSTWLNQDRWEDDVLQFTNGNGGGYPSGKLNNNIPEALPGQW